MFFKNLQIYGLGLLPFDLETQLARGQFTPCPSHQPRSRGWVSPRNDGVLAYSLGSGQYLVALKTEERLLPKDVVNREVAERAAVLQDAQGYAPGRKALRELKDLVTQDFMPRAFTRQRVTYAILDERNGRLLIDAAMPAKSEEVLEHLRHTLDDFKVRLIRIPVAPTFTMADWLARGEAPPGFSVDQDCALRSAGEEKSTVAYSSCPLEGDDVKSHLADGKLPTKLAMTWGEQLSFVLTDRLEIKRLVFLDLEAEENGEDQFDADMALMTGTLSRFLPQLLDALGGEVEDEAA